MGARVRCLDTSRVTIGSDRGGRPESRMRTPDCRQVWHAGASLPPDGPFGSCQEVGAQLSPPAAPRPLLSWVASFLSQWCPSCSCRALAPACAGARDLWSKVPGEVGVEASVREGGGSPAAGAREPPFAQWHLPWSWDISLRAEQMVLRKQSLCALNKSHTSMSQLSCPRRATRAANRVFLVPVEPEAALPRPLHGPPLGFRIYL